jgi:hypothetical protein
MKYSRFSGADRFGPCRLHADIYEPIVNYLGIAGGIVKRGERHRPGVAMPPDIRMDGHAPPLESAKAQLGENWRKCLAWAKLTEIED